MAVKLVALYQQPEDPKAFDQHYFHVHVPLAEKMPGLQHAEYLSVKEGPMGTAGYYLIAELTFASMADLNAAMASPEGKAAAKDLMTFAGNRVQLVITETVKQPVGV